MTPLLLRLRSLTTGSHDHQDVEAAAAWSGTTLIRRPSWSNLTVPSMSEKIVQSRPRATFLPACHFVPFCRQMMAPGRAYWPPYSLIPNIFGFESRPLRLEPCPFL